MRLLLEHGELVEIYSYDNRRMNLKCTRICDGLPVLELLPRVRYLLRVEPFPNALGVASDLFLRHGLLILPDDVEDGIVRKVAILNLSEKAVRVAAGCDLKHSEWQRSPGGSTASQPSEPPADEPIAFYLDAAA
jgi:hypothetical protein